MDQIIKSIKSTLERTPPELAADLLESGITLAGGGALLRGLDRMLARETGLPVRRADDPLTAVARGTGVVLDQIDSLWGCAGGWSRHGRLKELVGELQF